jgi:acyl-CoA synthetase (AMP-forming)/AMP-acid ligase II
VLSLVHVLEWRAAVHPGSVAISDHRGAALTYAELAAATEQATGGFAAAGFAPGDVVPIVARNQVGWVTAMLGLIRAGALPAAVNWRLAAPEVAALLGLARPAAVVADDACGTLARQAVVGLDRPVPVLTVPGASGDGERAVAVLGCRFRQNYASSETGPLPITSLPPEDHDPLRGRLGTAGKPSLGWEVRLGERGEVQVRGPAPLPGYWNDTATWARSLTSDGFYRTGDVGAFDADGYLTIIDRLNDLVITGGENVFPAEVEAVLAQHPAVADVAVIGIPDDRWGETVHAVVVAAPGFEVAGFDAAGLTGWARERLAGFKCPTGVTLVPELPRNATGKVLRAALREPFWAGRDRLVS